MFPSNPPQKVKKKNIFIQLIIDNVDSFFFSRIVFYCLKVSTQITHAIILNNDFMANAQ